MTTVEMNAVEAIRSQIADAARSGTPLRISGRGTWLDAGRPVHATEVVSTRELSGITEYVPGDLTLTALAGTTLAEIRDATAAHGQWLALNPYGSNGGSIGATIATASTGPLQTFFGRSRDLVLGVEFVTGAGVLARGGGRVVKNVAGFDVTRLHTGAWGTLGVITEVTVRLHARPVADESFAITLRPDFGPGRVRQELQKLPFLPYSCEFLNDELARKLVGAGTNTLLVRIGGNREAVKAQRSAFAEFGGIRDIDPLTWDSLRAAEPAGALVFRLSRLPAEIDRAWAEANTLAASARGTLLHANPIRGIVRCIVPPSATAEGAVEALLRSGGDTVCVGERLPVAHWILCPALIDTAGLATGIRRAFDPYGILNPGILYPEAFA